MHLALQEVLWTWQRKVECLWGSLRVQMLAAIRSTTSGDAGNSPREGRNDRRRSCNFDRNERRGMVLAMGKYNSTNVSRLRSGDMLETPGVFWFSFSTISCWYTRCPLSLSFLGFTWQFSMEYNTITKLNTYMVAFWSYSHVLRRWFFLDKKAVRSCWDNQDARWMTLNSPGRAPLSTPMISHPSARELCVSYTDYFRKHNPTDQPKPRAVTRTNSRRKIQQSTTDVQIQDTAQICLKRIRRKDPKIRTPHSLKSAYRFRHVLDSEFSRTDQYSTGSDRCAVASERSREK